MTFYRMGSRWLMGCALASMPLMANAYSNNINEPTPEDASIYPSIDATTDADSLGGMFTRGSLHGSVRSLYFSTHNAYFTRGENQDTMGYGGYLNYHSARYKGLSFGIGAIYQRSLHHDNPDQNVTELATNQNNIGEAWIRYEVAGFRVTAGNQPLSLPFANTKDWRVTPNLFQAVDLRYGSDDNFIEATKVFRYKSWGAGSFTRTTMENQRWDPFGPLGNDKTTNGMWAIGAHGTYFTPGVQWNGDAWHEVYQDTNKIDLLQGRAQLTEHAVKPFVALQFIRGSKDGDNYIRQATGKGVASQVYGAQAGFDYGTLNVAVGFDHTVAKPNGYLHGALLTPYEHNSASGPFFAQPFFTSTQDLGSGNAYSLDVSGLWGNDLIWGARYTHMDLSGYNGVNKSLNQNEYMGYLIYNFPGALKGLSLSDWAGIQTSSRPDTDMHFLQNRVVLSYSF